MAEEESDLFDSLPDDLVIAILAKLSSSAGCPSDFVTVLMTSKRLNTLALHSLVLSKGSSKMLPIKAKNWSESAHRFLKLCADAGNAEACYALLLLSDLISLQKWQELFVKFCEDEKITEKFKAFCLKEEEKRIFSEELEKLRKAIEEDEANQFFLEDLLVTLDKNLEIEMIQRGGLESVTAVNSSSFGAMGTPFERAELKRKREEELDGARWGKRPATAYTTPSRPPIGGFMAEARQNYHQSAAALATEVPLFSTNGGAQVQTRDAAHDKEASTSSRPPPQVEPRNFTGDELGLGSEKEVSVYDPVEFQLKEYGAFCEEPGITDMFKDFKEEQEFKEEVKKLEEVLMKDGINAFFDMGVLPYPLDHEMWTGYLAGYREGELQPSTTWTMPWTAGAMNSTATGETHHDPLGMQGDLLLLDPLVVPAPSPPHTMNTEDQVNAEDEVE